MKATQLLFLLFVGLITAGCASIIRLPSEGNVLGRDFVPDKATAMSIALAVLVPVYGEKQIASEMPLSVALYQDTWIVSGTLPRGYEGGVALVVIDKRRGTILQMHHGE